jgi:aryl-alcohol dehydrogenase-like predicted oxidoreductase
MIAPTPLPTTTLGRSGLTVTRIGLGLAALGRPSYINLGHAADIGHDRSVDALRARAHHVLRAAYEAGVRHVDAARSYGLAEDFLASWLKEDGIAPGAVTVSSKWGYRYTAGWRDDAETHEVKDLSADHLRRQLRESLDLLGDHLQLYQIHSATIDSGVLADDDVLGELARLKRERGIAVGLSTTGPEQAATIDCARETGAFDTVQATWNLHEPSAGPALARAHDAGMGVIVKEAVANGRLTARDAPPALATLADQHGTTPDALAIAAVLAQPWADVVLSGASTPEMLASNLKAFDVPSRGRPRPRAGRAARRAGRGLLGHPQPALLDLTRRAVRRPARPRCGRRCRRRPGRGPRAAPRRRGRRRPRPARPPAAPCAPRGGRRCAGARRPPGTR